MICNTIKNIVKIDDLNEVIYFRAHRKQPESMPFGERVVNFLKEWWLHLLIVLATLLVLGYGIYAAVSLFGRGERPWPFGTKTEEAYTPNEAETDEAMPSVSDEIVVEEKKIDTVALFQHDIDYLKKNDVWRKDSIRTKEFMELYEAIASGRNGDV